jgi:Na+-driven multidrug efflux pump
VFRILLSYVLVYVFGLGVLSVWIAMIVDWVFRSVLFVRRWKSRKWQNYSAL